MKKNNTVAAPVTTRRVLSMRKMGKALEILQNNVTKLGEEDTKTVESTVVATSSGFMINFLGDDFNLSINLVTTKGGIS
jgi:hypothetical protein